MTATDPTEAADAPTRAVDIVGDPTRPATVTPELVESLFAAPEAGYVVSPAGSPVADADADAKQGPEPDAGVGAAADAKQGPESHAGVGAAADADAEADAEALPAFLTATAPTPVAAPAVVPAFTREGGMAADVADVGALRTREPALAPNAVLTPDAAPDAAPATASADRDGTDSAPVAPPPAEASPAALPPAALPPAVFTPSPIPPATTETQWADSTRPATALTWVDPAVVADRTATPAAEKSADPRALMRGAKLRSAFWRPSVLTPLGLLAGLVCTYVGGTLLWPLHELPPTVEAVAVAPVAAPGALASWPGVGSASVGVGGFTTIASSPEAVSIASVTKVVSSLMVLDRMPLAPGEQGPEFSFTDDDSEEYWDYRRSDQSALDVPVDGVLTEYQLLQGTLLASANNYIDRLAAEIWGSDRRFAEAAEVWLRERNLQGITVVTPSGFDEDNVATPEALVRLGEYAMKNPVFAEIVGTRSVEIPGAGLVENTNGLMVDPGVVGIKTGTLVGWNLLAAKDITVDGTTVRVYASALNQPDDESRLAVTRALFAEVEAALRAQPPVVTRGTVAGEVTTAWGEKVEIVTDADAAVVLWNGASSSSTPELALTDDWEKGAEVGTLTTTGPVNSTTTTLTLAAPIEGPSAWWRLTHPLELLGLTDEQR